MYDPKHIGRQWGCMGKIKGDNAGIFYDLFFYLWDK